MGRTADSFKRSYTDYISRINRVIDYIENNLDSELKLEDLASYCNFSKFHFHRIFSALSDESLSEFIRRIRLEKAAYYLITTPKKSITDIALMCGFASSQSFAKRFKKHFQITATQYRNAGVFAKVSKNGQDLSVPPDYRSFGNGEKPEISIKDFPGVETAYLRYTGPYSEDVDLFSKLFGKLMSWADSKNLTANPLDIYIIYHDEPRITEERRLRISLCLPVDKSTSSEGEIGRMRISPGKYVFATFHLKSDEYGFAWNWLYKVWLPSSGYEPGDQPAFEYYHQGSDSSGNDPVKVSLCIPIKKLKALAYP